MSRFGTCVFATLLGFAAVIATLLGHLIIAVSLPRPQNMSNRD